MGSEPARRRGGGGGSGTPAGLRQALPEEEEDMGGEAAKGGSVAAPCASPPLYRRGRGWWLALQAPRVYWPREEEGNPSFPSPPIAIPLFRDLDLIPSGYDPIPFRGDLGAPRPGVWGLAPLPTSMWAPHAGGPPLRNLLEPSRYNTEKTRTFSGTLNMTSHI